MSPIGKYLNFVKELWLVNKHSRFIKPKVKLLVRDFDACLFPLFFN